MDSCSVVCNGGGIYRDGFCFFRIMKINKTAILVEKFGWALFPRRHELWLVLNQDIGEDSHIVQFSAGPCLAEKKFQHGIV